MFSNNKTWNEIYNNTGTPIILQNTKKGGVAIGTSNLTGDKFKVATGGQYFRVSTWGAGVVDSDWTNTLMFSNNKTWNEIYNNTGTPIILQNTKKGGVAIGTNNLTGDKFKVATGGQYFRVSTWGAGVVDSDWTNTLMFSNNKTSNEIYNNAGTPIILQNTVKGSVAIGTTETGTHKLAVEGSIGAREVVVEVGAWSDFVFDNEYKLKELDEVESFIEQNNHLPDIPSEKEVLKNGVSLGEMNAKLLQKIEELTLYVIEINKEVRILRDENKELKERIK